MIMMKSNIKNLAATQGLENPQQFAIKAALPWSTAKNIWEGNLAFRHAHTLHKAARALKCEISDLYRITGNTND